MRNNIFNNIYRSKEFNDINNIPKFPYIIDIELTNNCNLNCIMCYRNIMKRDRGYIEEDIFNKVIDECSNYDVGIRFIRWGEPFLHPRIVEFCRRVKYTENPLHITTNGLLLNTSLMKNIVNIGVDSIIFSMQGSTKEEYERMRNNNKYDTLISNVDKLIEIRGDKEKPYIHISSTMTGKDNKEDIEKFKNYWDNKVDSVGVGITNMSRFNKEDIQKKIHKPCKEVYQRLNVDWDGTISACCEDYDRLLSIGNIRNNTLYNCWNNNSLLNSYRCILNNRKFSSLTLCKDCYHAYEHF